ncbi:recombinase family protein [Methylomagnum sp.]
MTELSRLGRSTAEVIALVNALIGRNIRLIALKQNLAIDRQDMNPKIIVTLFSLFAELERDLSSLRTREALAAKKAQGQPLGKPRGTLQKSKFDKDAARIKELLGYGPSVRKIAKVLGCSSHIALNTYINKRGLRQPAKA